MLYEFGFGLSYTTFAVTGDCPTAHTWTLSPGVSRGALRAGAVPGGNTSCTVTVRNTGGVAGDEVVMVFARPSAGTARARAAARDPLATKRLVAFQRVSLAPGQSVDVPFSFDPTALAEVDAAGDRVIYAGEYSLGVGRGQAQEVAWGVRVRVAGEGDRVLVRRYPKL